MKFGFRFWKPINSLAASHQYRENHWCICVWTHGHVICKLYLFVSLDGDGSPILIHTWKPNGNHMEIAHQSWVGRIAISTKEPDSKHQHVAASGRLSMAFACVHWSYRYRHRACRAYSMHERYTSHQVICCIFFPSHDVPYYALYAMRAQKWAHWTIVFIQLRLILQTIWTIGVCHWLRH